MKGGLLLPLVAAGLAACASTGEREAALLGLADSAYDEVGPQAESVDRLEALLPAALDSAAAELRIELLLTRAHLRASLRADGYSLPETPNSAELVATAFHASAASALLDSGGEHEDPALAEEFLRVAGATTMLRLGFATDAVRTAAGRPAVPAAIEDLTARHELPAALQPWLAVLGFEEARDRDELAAYRFAVHALEAQARYGYALPTAEAARLARWIEEGASVRFVCPESGTPFVPGLRRSPRSGVPHVEYVAEPREG